VNDIARPEPQPITGARPFFPEADLPAILAEISEVLRGGRLILGPKVRALEEAWARVAGTKHAVAVSSCTAALEIAYRHVGVEGREVIVPTNTFVATAVAAVNAGARVVFADMEPADFCIDIDDAIARATSRTAAIVVVHVAGIIPSRIDRLRAHCKERGTALIEDCAHAPGATLRGRSAGSFGDVACFSLYPTKVITCGTGGIVATDDEAAAELARSLRHHGQGASLEDIVHAGNDWLLDEVHAVLAFAQLQRLGTFLDRRRALAARYEELLRADPRITLPYLASELKPAYYKYPVLLPPEVDRGRVRRQLLEEYGIETGALYSPPAHLMPLFRNMLGTAPGMFPKAEAALARQLCLPIHATLSPEDAERSVRALDAVLRTQL